MIHDLDVALHIAGRFAGQPPVEALGVAVLGQHEDVAQARLEFANGCVANLSASRISHVPRRQMQVWAERGFVTVDFANRTANVMAEPSDDILNNGKSTWNRCPPAKGRTRQRNTFSQDDTFAAALSQLAGRAGQCSFPKSWPTSLAAIRTGQALARARRARTRGRPLSCGGSCHFGEHRNPRLADGDRWSRFCPRLGSL